MTPRPETPGARRRCAAALCWATLAVGTAGGSAAQPTPAGVESAPAAAPQPQRIELRGPDVGFPGIGRVLIAFGVCAVLAAGAAIVLRRYWPGFGSRSMAGAGTVRVVERLRVDAQLRLHVVEASGARLLIAESRGGVAITSLPPAPPAA